MTPDVQNPYQPPTDGGPPPLVVPPPIPTPPWNAWWTLFWGVVLVVAWQVFSLIGILIAFVFSGGFADIPDPVNEEAIAKALEDFALDGDALGIVTFLSIFVVCPLCFFIGNIRPGWTGLKYLGNERFRWWHWPLWTVLTIGSAVVFGLLSPYFGLDETDPSMVKMAKSTQYPILLYLGVGIGAPLIEEFIFRGLLYRGWRHSRLALPGSLVLTSLLWASLHVQYPIIVIAYIFVLGLIFGLAREKSGNIWLPVFLHAVNNGLATIHMLQL